MKTKWQCGEMTKSSKAISMNGGWHSISFKKINMSFPIGGFINDTSEKGIIPLPLKTNKVKKIKNINITYSSGGRSPPNFTVYNSIIRCPSNLSFFSFSRVCNYITKHFIALLSLSCNLIKKIIIKKVISENIKRLSIICLFRTKIRALETIVSGLRNYKAEFDENALDISIGAYGILAKIDGKLSNLPARAYGFLNRPVNLERSAQIGIPVMSLLLLWAVDGYTDSVKTIIGRDKDGNPIYQIIEEIEDDRGKVQIIHDKNGTQIIEIYGDDDDEDDNRIRRRPKRKSKTKSIIDSLSEEDLEKIKKQGNKKRIEDLVDKYHDAGEQLYKKKEYEKASGLYKKSLILRNDANSHYQLGRCYDRVSKGKKAVNEYDKALALSKKGSDLYKKILEAEIRSPPIKKDVALAEKLVSYEPNNIGYLNTLGCAYYWNKQKDKAKEIFEKVLGLSPNNKFAKIYLKNL